MKPLRISSEFYKVLPSELATQLETFYLADKKFWHGCDTISFPRYGPNKIWDFHYDSDYLLNPDLDCTFDQTFSQVTDSRAIEIRNHMRQHDQELAVFWSGGIDSTVILSAIVKNFQTADLKNVTVFANNQSYFENPTFFHNVIEKYHLRTTNFTNFSNNAIQHLFDTHIVTDGEPADKLWMVNVALQFESTYGQGLLGKSYQSTSDRFIDFLTGYMTIAQAQLYYEYLIQNIQETGVNIHTLGDLFWWINFNFHWIEHLLIWYQQFPVKNASTYQQFKKNYKPWYNSNEYQLWSLADRPKLLLPDQLNLYKMPAKQYIYELDNDRFYLNYKSKVGSSKSLTKVSSDLVILADGSKLDHTNNTILTEFINTNCLLC